MLFFASVLSSTALATDITGVQQVTSIAKDWNMIGNDEGVAYIYVSSDKNSADFRYTTTPRTTTISVASGIDAVINFSASSVDGNPASQKTNGTPTSFRYHIGGSNNLNSSTPQSITISGGSGATSQNTSLSFYGSEFETGGVVAGGTNRTYVGDIISVSDITFDFYGTVFGSNKLEFTNAVFNLNRGRLQNSTTQTVNGVKDTQIILSTKLDNSTYNLNPENATSSTNLGYMGAVTLLNNSKLNVLKGTVSASTLSISDSVVNIASGAKLNLTSSNTFSATDITNINVAKGGTFQATSSKFYFTNGVDSTLSGGSYYIQILSGANSGKSNIYISAESLTTSGTDGGGSYRTYFVGFDKASNTSAVNWTTNTFQLNDGGKIVLVNGSSINYSGSGAGTFNFADMTAYDSSVDVKSGKFNYVEKGTSITSKATRFNGGLFDGKITVNKGYEANSDWNYTFALGVKSQSANVILGENAEITVNGATSVSDSNGTKGNIGQLFTIAGNITSNAGTGKIVSDANAGFFIKSKNTSTKTVLTLNTTDAFAVGGAENQASSTFELEAGANVEFVINADNNIGSVAFGNETSKLLLSIAESKVLTVGSFVNLADSGVISIALGDTSYGSFRIVDMDESLSNYLGNTTIKFVDENGVDRILNDNLFIKEIESGVFSVSTVVPEPAEWAMIFGAIALAFVANRRRK